MLIPFQVVGLPITLLEELNTLSIEERQLRGIQKCTVDAKPGYPCRLSLADAEVGEEVFLLPYKHHSVDSPYQAAGPIYIRTEGGAAALPPNKLPKMLGHRFLSLRVYDKDAMMIGAQTLKGTALAETIQKIFSVPAAAYIQVHNAGPGCYNCEIRRG
ncbi:MAG: DUF1203 domain-containing protein [Bacteroidota bacterium]